MKKKILITSMLVTAALSIGACSNSAQAKIDTPNSIEVEIASGSEIVENTKVLNGIKTIGIFKSSNVMEDVNGEYKQLTFTDEQGNDFIANVSKETFVPDEMVEGNTYEVTHSEIMTMSLPGIYPEVFQIQEVK